MTFTEYNSTTKCIIHYSLTLKYVFLINTNKSDFNVILGCRNFVFKHSANCLAHN